MWFFIAPQNPSKIVCNKNWLLLHNQKPFEPKSKQIYPFGEPIDSRHFIYFVFFSRHPL